MPMQQISEQEIVEFMENAPDLVNQLYTTLKVLGVEQGLDERFAQNLAANAAQKMVDIFGGEVIYIPKGLSMQLSARDLAIFNEFNGKNYRELAHKYNITVPYVYRLIKRIRKAEINKRQMDMFG